MDMLRRNCYDHLIRNGAKISKRSLYRVLSKCVKNNFKMKCRCQGDRKGPLERKASTQRRTQKCRPRTILRKNLRESGDTPSPSHSVLVRVITIAKATWEGKG